jgi:hypothetical protein
MCHPFPKYLPCGYLNQGIHSAIVRIWPELYLGGEPELLRKAADASHSVIYNNGKRGLPRLPECGGGVYEWQS